MKAITLTAMMVSFNAFALTETINGIEWSYERCDDGLAITGSVIPEGKMDIVVPDTIGGVPVVEIGEGAVASETFDRSLFAGSNPDLYKTYSLKLPAQVRRIKAKAFFNRFFSALIFPETVESLDRFAFGRGDVQQNGSYAYLPMAGGVFAQFMPGCKVEFYGKRPRITNDLGLSYSSALVGNDNNAMFYGLSVWVQNNWCSEYADEEYDTSSNGFVHRFEKGYLFDYPSFEFSSSDFDKDAGGGLVAINPTRCELKLHEESRFYKCNDMAIYYTVNGEDPVAKETQTCFKYTKPFQVASNVVLKVWSGVGKISTYQCRVVDYVKDVVFDNCGVFNDSKCSVSLSCATEGALIYYTLDGSEPSAENGTLYTGTFTIYESVTVKAIAFKDDWLASEVASATFEKANKLSEAGGLLNYLPESDADYPWSVTADDSHDGKSAIKSGEIAAGESTWMKVSVPGTGRITFWWKRTGNGNAVFKVDDEIAAEAMGINLAKHKSLSFCISSFFAGVGGALFAMFASTVQAKTFTSAMTYEILLIVVIGGIGSVSGSCIAAFLYIACSEWWLRFLDNGGIGSLQVPFFRDGFRKVVFSVVIMIIVLFFSRGIMGNKELSFAGLIRRIQAKKAAKSAQGGAAE